MKTAEATKDSIALAYLYANRAHADLGYTPNTGEGLELGLKSLAEFKRLGGDPAMYTLAFNITDYLVGTGKSKEAIQLLQDLIKKYPPVSPIDRQEAYIPWLLLTKKIIRLTRKNITWQQSISKKKRYRSGVILEHSTFISILAFFIATNASMKKAGST